MCLCVSPIMAIGNALNAKFFHGLVNNQHDMEKDAALLCGDSISNFRTVQSFGHNELFVKKYQDMLESSHKLAKWTQFKSGLAFGVTQFGTYFVFAVMFYGGGEIIT